MGRAGRRRYEERFTLERMVEQTVAVYETLLSQSRLRAPGASRRGPRRRWGERHEGGGRCGMGLWVGLLGLEPESLALT
ncbi:MAG TPA: hypothetical protein VIK99_09740, partial [Thermaerobacter sp.]